MSLTNHLGKYDIVLADPPWPMYGPPDKNGAAAKHYPLMTIAEISAMPVRELFIGPGALFLWTTCPRLDLAMSAISSWGLHYRGVAFVWVKTTKTGVVMGARGVPPTGTKPTSELCLLATTCKRGRPFPLLSAKVSQVVMAPVAQHSRKPNAVRQRIVQLYGDRPRVELFARERVEGWVAWGNHPGL